MCQIWSINIKLLLVLISQFFPVTLYCANSPLVCTRVYKLAKQEQIPWMLQMPTTAINTLKPPNIRALESVPKHQTPVLCLLFRSIREYKV